MIENVKRLKTESQPKVVEGIVASNAMNKTAVVTIEVKTAHPVYGKFVKKTTKYYVHDENNVLKIGDLVRIRHSRPLSKLKRWVLEEVISSQLV